MTMHPRIGFPRLTSAAIMAGCLIVGLMSLAHVAWAAADHLQIGVLVFDKVLTSDVTAPMEVFGNASKKSEFSKYQVAIIAPEKKLITTEEGVPIMPQYSIDDAPKLEALIVPSAYDMAPLLDNKKLIAFIKGRGHEVKWLASNCAGAKLLGNAGLLQGRRVTTYPGGEKWLKLHHPSIDVVWNQKVVVDETTLPKLVTSNGSLVSYQAALKMLELMTNADFSKKVADDIYYSILLSEN
jgi:transcriptional regulator GlxA family with amidase domain